MKFQKGKLISVSSNDSILHYDLSRQTIKFITASKDSVLIQLQEEYLRLQVGDILDSIIHIEKVAQNSDCLNAPNSVNLAIYNRNIISSAYGYCTLQGIGLGDSLSGIINLMPSLNQSDNSFTWTVILEPMRSGSDGRTLTLSGGSLKNDVTLISFSVEFERGYEFMSTGDDGIKFIRNFMEDTRGIKVYSAPLVRYKKHGRLRKSIVKVSSCN